MGVIVDGPPVKDPSVALGTSGIPDGSCDAAAICHPKVQVHLAADTIFEDHDGINSCLRATTLAVPSCRTGKN